MKRRLSLLLVLLLLLGNLCVALGPALATGPAEEGHALAGEGQLAVEEEEEETGKGPGLETGSGEEQPDGEEEAGIYQTGTSPHLTIITGTTAMVASLVEAYHNLMRREYGFTLKIFAPGDLDITDRLALVEESVLRSDAVLLEMIGANRADALRGIFSKLEPQAQPEILLQRSAEKAADGSWAQAGLLVEMVRDLEVVVNKDDTDWTRLNQYLINGGVANMERLLLYLASRFAGLETTESLDPVVLLGNFAYHPAADSSSKYYEGDPAASHTGIFYEPPDYFAWYESRLGFDPEAPWIGLIGYDSFFKNADMDLYNDTVLALERLGLNVIPVYPRNQDRILAARKFFFRDLNGDGHPEPAIHAFILCIGFQFDSRNELGTLQLFKDMNVPVLNPIYTGDLEKWFANPAGAMDVLHWQVAMPELEGRIEPVLMGGNVTLAVDEATGAVVTKKITLPDRIERLAGRTAAWARLKKSANQDKKVALLYYNYGGGRDDIGASYLNSTRSVAKILQALQQQGYRVNEDGELNGPEESVCEEAVLEIIFRKGRNVGGWAPGELERLAAADGIITLEVDGYLEWFRGLPGALQEKVEAEWGPAPGNVMVHQGRFVLPGHISGNVFFGPQPMRGWGEDIQKIIHSPHLPPSHQYLAFYYWLQHCFKADAVIHLGTHGTAEWLPGKAVGLAAECWPDVVHGHLPNIYPYIVNNPGEGTQAKRRGYAVLLSHLTAAVANTELYGNLLELHNLIHEYEKYMSDLVRDNQALERIKTRINFLLAEENMAAEMGLDPDRLTFEELVEAVHDFLHLMEATVTPLGLHTFGVAPQGERFDLMVNAIINYDPENREAQREQIAADLARTTEEMDMLLLALEGGFVPPGLGKDPVRNPDVMPTGRNIKTFDPRTVPDRAAWRIGSELADKLLASHYAAHGSYPQSVGVVLWAIETMRTGGESIALAMRLMGVEPRWDSAGRVTSFRVVPVSELGRPRIDVALTGSSLFRDAFSLVNSLLDRVARQLAKTGESFEDNYIKKHYEEIFTDLLSAGLSAEEADFLAASRVFSAEPGAYGLGLSELMDFSDQWDGAGSLAELYISRMGFIFGNDRADGSPVYGIRGQDLLARVLSRVEAVVQVRDSIYGTLDNDDVAQYLGGLKLAVQWLSGVEIPAYIANSRLGPNHLLVQPLQEFVSLELWSRLLNPVFVREMLEEGYSGARTVAKWITNAFYMDITTGAISDRSWSRLAETYVFDEEVRKRLDPYALQSIAATLLESARKDLWAATAEEKARLADIYLETAVKYGVVCCHHTCRNLTLNQWAANFSLLDDRLLDRFREIFKEATYRDLSFERPVMPPFSPDPVTEVQEPRVEEIKVELPLELPAAEEDRSEPEITPELIVIAKPVGPEPQERLTQPHRRTAGALPAPPAPEQQPDLPQPKEREREKTASPEKQVRAYEVIPEQPALAPVASAVAVPALLVGLLLVGLAVYGYSRKKKAAGS